MMSWSWGVFLDIAWLLFLVSLLVYFWRARCLAVKARDWHKTQGRIIVCEWSKEGHRLWPKIQFSYEVDGQEYIGEHIFFDTSHHSPDSAYAKSIAYKVAEAYKNDQLIDVYYDPKQPQHAAIDTKVAKKLNLIVLFLLGLIVIHLIVMATRFF